jgi:hypothetical protein
MNNLNTCYISLLKYCPSYVLGEVVNIGILFILPNENKCVFYHPTKLSRITKFYPLADLNNLKKQLNSIYIKTNKIEFHNSPDKLIEKYFGTREAVNLFFEKPLYGKYVNVNILIEEYKKQYFSVYEDDIEYKKHDEKYLKHLFEEKIRNERIDINLIRKEYLIESKRNHIKFDFAWRNGNLNLVQPLGFDLKKEQSIVEKSFNWVGKISQLKSVILEKNIHIDFLVSEPQNIDFQDEYNKSIENLLDIGSDFVDIISESDLNTYVKKIANSIHN